MVLCIGECKQCDEGLIKEKQCKECNKWYDCTELHKGYCHYCWGYDPSGDIWMSDEDLFIHRYTNKELSGGRS